MKNILLIAAIAVIAVFAFSCTEPDVSLTKFDYAAVAKAYEAENGQDSAEIGAPTLTAWQSVGSSDDVEITITFPDKADILKDPSTANLNAFLSILTYTNGTADDDWYESATPSITSSGPTYTFERQNGNAIVIKASIKADFYTPGHTDQKYYVFKLDADKYTFSNGIKRDIDGNGKGGEAKYDDTYILIPSSFNFGQPTFYRPGNKGWNLNLGFINYGTGSSTTDTWASASSTTSNTLAYVQLATLTTVRTWNPSGYYEIKTVGGKAIQKEVAALFANQIVLQKLDTAAKKWVDVEGAVAVFTDTITYYGSEEDFYSFGIKNITVDNNTAYRAMWKGPANIETTKEYYGVKQRIYVDGAVSYGANFREAYKVTTQISYDSWQDNPYSEYWDEYSTVDFSSNYIGSSELSVKEVVRTDFSTSGVVVKVLFPVLSFKTSSTSERTYVGLEEQSLEAIKDKVKIAYRPGKTGWNSSSPDYDSMTAENPKNFNYVNIKSVKYGYDGYLTSGSKNTTYKNIIEFELDPNFQLNQETRGLLLIMNEDGLKYTGSRFIFGSRYNWLNNNLEAYPITISSDDAPDFGTKPTISYPASVLSQPISWANNNAKLSWKKDNNGVYEIDVEPGTQRYHAIFAFNYGAVTGYKYQYSFDIKGDADTTGFYSTQVLWNGATTDWQGDNNSDAGFEITSGYVTRSFTLDEPLKSLAGGHPDSSQLMQIQLGGITGKVYIKNVKVQRVK